MFGFAIKPWHKRFLIWRNCSCTSHIQQNTHAKCFTSRIASNKWAQIKPFRCNSGVSSFFCSNNYWTPAFLFLFSLISTQSRMAGWLNCTCLLPSLQIKCLSSNREGFMSVIKLFLFLPVSCSPVEEMSDLGLSALRIKPSGSAALLSQSCCHEVKGWVFLNSVWFISYCPWALSDKVLL